MPKRDSTSPDVLIARFCAVLMQKGILTLADARLVLGDLAPSDIELLEHRPAGMSETEAIDLIAKAQS